MKKRERFKSIEIDCDKQFISINGKEIDITTVTSVDIHIEGGFVEFEIVNFLSGDLNNGRTETSKI